MYLARFGRVSDYQIKCSGRDFAEAAVAIQRHSNADGRIVAGEAEPAFHEPIVNLVDV